MIKFAHQGLVVPSSLNYETGIENSMQYINKLVTYKQ